MNQVNLTGRITHDLEIKQTQTGKNVLDFQIAVRESKDSATFIKCQAWERTAEIINDYAGKGVNLAISGSLKVERYQGKDGKNVEKTYVRVSTVEILDRKKETKDANQEFTESLKGTEYADKFGGDVQIDEKDLPFY